LEVLGKVADKLDLEEVEKTKIEMLLFAFAPTKVLEGLLDNLKNCHKRHLIQEIGQFR
jgi:hypothetical protein